MTEYSLTSIKPSKIYTLIRVTTTLRVASLIGLNVWSRWQDRPMAVSIKKWDTLADNYIQTQNQKRLLTLERILLQNTRRCKHELSKRAAEHTVSTTLFLSI